MTIELGESKVTAPELIGAFNFNLRSDNPQLNFFPPATRMDLQKRDVITAFTRKFQTEIDAAHTENMQKIDSEIKKDVEEEGGSNESMDVTTPEPIVTKEHVIHVKLYYDSKAEEKNQGDKAASLKVGPDLKPYYSVSDVFPDNKYQDAGVRKQRLIDWALGYEALRLAQVYAETARRLKVAADALAVIQAEQARLTAANEAVRNANTFRAPGSASAAGSLFMTSAGTVTVVEAAALTLQAAIRAAISALGGAVAGVGAGLLVGVSALFYSSKLANGELSERYAFSTPVSDLVQDFEQDLNSVAAAGGTVDMAYRISSKTAADGQSEVFVVKTDGVTVPSKVRVVAARYDAAQKVYTATTADVPPRTLTWTPIVNPGNNSTTSPNEQTVPTVYTGATVTPVEGRIDAFPEVTEASFDDFITVFPADSGLPPIYTMFRDRREDAGVATGVGQPVSGNWLGAASQGKGAPIPSQIADQLRGKEFKNFKGFREALWKAVANDPELATQFSSVNMGRMRKNGYAPYAIPSEQVGEKSKYELHHVIFLKNDGELYDIDNLRVVTPKEHDALHKFKQGE
ncbi:S-type pyocin domain-containing protein [Pseudomonas sp. P7759]|uniref:S-type pyocin domain-containing protein n=1 Tax=Pseudomonas sp. P7759 TaxID=2738831 RepID=UPI00210BC404|nr:S-type pyocin domain-containing protein [Pseudomonas sp. P7759]